jgi:hypothetical protein
MTFLSSRPTAYLLVCASAALLADASRAADTPHRQITSIDQVQFQQQNAQAQMEELQNRMFRLAEATRQAEPDDAAKLLMAIRAAREQLILEQMRGNLNLLNNKDYTHAAEEQAQIIAKLEELKKLLTSGVSDLQMLLEKLRAIDQANKKLDAATAEEKRQKAASEKLAGANPAGQKPLDNLKRDQEQNRKATDNIAQAVKNLGGAAKEAGDKLGSASGSMTKAEGALGSGKPNFAMIEQKDAVASMEEARKKLNEERDKVMADVEKLVRKQVVMNLTEMLERQESVRAGTELAVQHLSPAQGTGNRETLLKLRQLGVTETSIVRIADQTVDLIEQTQFSVALPPAIRRVQQKVATIAATLDDSKADAKLVQSEIQVEKDLQDLLDTFKELASAKVTPGNCNCKGDKNKLEAELKVVRMMQLRVNDETLNADKQRPPVAADLPANVNPMLREKILATRDGQTDVKTVLDKIHQQLTGPDPQEQAK